jgi:hypothetical protein
MTFMAKARLALALMNASGDLKAIVQTGLIVGVFGLAIAALIMRQSSPIISLDRDTGTVVNFVGGTPDRTGRAVGGDRYIYGIRLGQNGTLVFVHGNPSELLTIGSHVSVERQHRQNGVETYRLPTD